MDLVNYSILSIYLFIGYKSFIAVDLEIGQLLQSSGYIVMSAILFGLIFGLLSARLEKSVHFNEILYAMPGDSIRHVAKLVACDTPREITPSLVEYQGNDYYFYSNIDDEEIDYSWDHGIVFFYIQSKESAKYKVESEYLHFYYREI